MQTHILSIVWRKLHDCASQFSLWVMVWADALDLWCFPSRIVWGLCSPCRSIIVMCLKHSSITHDWERFIPINMVMTGGWCPILFYPQRGILLATSSGISGIIFTQEPGILFFINQYFMAWQMDFEPWSFGFWLKIYSISLVKMGSKGPVGYATRLDKTVFGSHVFPQHTGKNLKNR